MKTIQQLAVHFMVHGGSWWPCTGYYDRLDHLKFIQSMLNDPYSRFTMRNFGWHSLPPLKESYQDGRPL